MKTNDELQKDVMAELKWDPQLRDVHTQIGVSANDGVVTLSGVVDTFGKKRAAERAAQRVHGVRVVATDIEIKVGPLGKKSDTEIAEMVNNALRWNSAVSEDKIEVKVDNGWVYLDGKVDWEYQRTSAQKNVEDLLAVRGVTNNITINARVIDTKVIKDKIAAAFLRSATIDSSNIKIEASGHKLILRGTVSSFAEKEEAERIAWGTPGVLTVDNKILIETEVFF